MLIKRKKELAITVPLIVLTEPKSKITDPKWTQILPKKTDLKQTQNSKKTDLYRIFYDKFYSLKCTLRLPNFT